MVVVETTLTQLQELIGKNITLTQLDETLFDIGFEVDEVEGDELKIDITPDRLDAISPVGLARIVKSYMGLAVEQPNFETYKSEYELIIDKSVKSVRPFTACAVIKGLNITESQLKEIIWVQEKLHATFGKNRKKAAIGIYPLEKITWPITFKGEKPEDISFQPLDSQTIMTGAQILSEHETGKVYAHLLEGHDVFPLFVDADNKVLSLPPLINSHDLGKVTVGEKEIFIECSGFDSHALQILLQNLVCLFSDMGGQIHDVIVNDGGTKTVMPNMKPETRPLLVEDVVKRTGVQLSAAEIVSNLEKMGHTAKILFEDTVEVSVPPYRSDIWHDVDVIDDVVRGYGINNLVPQVPDLATQGSVLPINQFESELTDVLVGLGFQEIKTLGVTDKADQFTKMNVSLDDAEFMTLGSTADKSINMLRTSLLPESLKLLMNNRSAPLPHKIFEFGHVIMPDDSVDVRSQNCANVCVSIAKDPSTFTDIKQVLESLATTLGVEFEFTEYATPYYVAGRSARFSTNGVIIGQIGEVHPAVLGNWDLTTPVSSFELDVKKLLNAVRGN